MILSAASALEPLYFAPRLSWVVDQITSPSGSTSRTEIRASSIVSVVTWLSSTAPLRATPTPLELPLADPRDEPWIVPVPPDTRPSIDPDEFAE